MPTESLTKAVCRALGSEVLRGRSLGGGDINDAYLFELADGRSVFVKTRDQVPEGMYAREAEGLRWLAEAGALPVPEVLAQDERLLALRFVPSGARAGDFDVRLGRGLAALHRAHPQAFGLATDNYIGSLPQRNEPCDTWTDFYRERRLMPQLAMAQRAGLADSGLMRGFQHLLDRLEGLCGPGEPPARLHGDLWSGNVHTDERGEPCLIDPACYGGHREVDLAMLQLFGSPSQRCFDAYDEVYPLAPGWRERVGLYQLYPLLVHVNLFGAGYVSQVRSTLARYL